MWYNCFSCRTEELLKMILIMVIWNILVSFIMMVMQFITLSLNINALILLCSVPTLLWRDSARRMLPFPPWTAPRTRSCTCSSRSYLRLLLSFFANHSGTKDPWHWGTLLPTNGGVAKNSNTGWKQSGPTRSTPHRQVNPGAQTPIMSGKSRRGRGEGWW